MITEKRTSDKDGKETRVVFSLQLRLANEEGRGKGAAGKDGGGRRIVVLTFGYITDSRYLWLHVRLGGGGVLRRIMNRL